MAGGELAAVGVDEGHVANQLRSVQSAGAHEQQSVDNAITESSRSTLVCE